MDLNSHDMKLFPDVAKIVSSVFDPIDLEVHPFLVRQPNHSPQINYHKY